MNEWLASILGFFAGVGVTAIYYQWAESRILKSGVERRHRNRYLPGLGGGDREPVEANALVTHDNPKTGRPEVDRTLIKPSPVPGWLAIVLVLFGAFSVVSSVIQNQRDSETRKQVRVAQCQNFAQLKFRGDDTRAGYTVLASAIRKLTDPKAKQADTVQTLNTLADYYEAQGRDPGGLPPLSQKAINDCKDGVFNDGYPNTDAPSPPSQTPPSPR